MAARRFFLSRLATLPLFAMTGVAAAEAETRKALKIMMKSAWGSDDPTKAAFPFLHGLALSEAGHEVQIFLLGEAVGLLRRTEAEQIYACGACSRARSVAESDLSQWGAKFGNPTIFVSLVEWADRIITE
jgi:sulfur relay (sulfurtransferase) complex TusBCD TusD component (DsrE family)